MIFVAGTSASGKTYMLSRLAEHRAGVIIIGGSQILRALGRPITRLTRDQAYENQWVLLHELKEQGLLGRPESILDGHATIETIEGPIAIPDDWFDAVKFAGLIHVKAHPELIAERRNLRGLPSTIVEAAKLQELEGQELVRQAKRLNVPFLAVDSSEAVAVAKFLAFVLSNLAER